MNELTAPAEFKALLKLKEDLSMLMKSVYTY